MQKNNLYSTIVITEVHKMKIVMLTEKANLSEEEKSKLIVRSLKAIYLATLIGFAGYATVDSINRINEAK